MGLFRASDSLDISLRILTEGIPKGDLVVDSISSSIRGSLRRINKIWEEFPAELADEAYRKASDDQELVENLLGISFVMCQVGITHVVSTYRFVQNSWVFHKESKHKLSKPLLDFLGISTKNISEKNLKIELMKKENPELPNKYSQITTLNAFGNYFKHNDEWKGNWIDSINPNATQEIIKSSVRNRSSEFCKEGLDYLVKGQSLDQVIKLWEIVDKWANSIKGKCIEDLRQCGCK